MMKKNNDYRTTIVISIISILTIITIVFAIKVSIDRKNTFLNTEIKPEEYSKISFLKKVIIEKNNDDADILSDLFLTYNQNKNFDYINNKFKIKTIIESKNDNTDVNNLLILINNSYKDKFINYYEYYEIMKQYENITPYNLIIMNKKIINNLNEYKKILEK